MLSAAVSDLLSVSLFCTGHTILGSLAAAFVIGFSTWMCVYEVVSNVMPCCLVVCDSMLEHDHGDYTTG